MKLHRNLIFRTAPVIAVSLFALSATGHVRADVAPRTAAASDARTGPAVAARGAELQQRRRAQPVRRPPPVPPLNRTAPRSVQQLQADLGEMLGTRVRSGQWGVMVTSVSRGDTLFAANADSAMVPASTMKLLTALLALERFGTDHRFSTDVLRDGSVSADGTLDGNIIIRGDGDPAFSRRFHRGPYSMPVDKLAEMVARAGIRRVTGSVIGDATAFDAETYPAGWQTRYRGAGYAARVSPLSLNENIVWVTVTPGTAGQPAGVTLEPATTTIPMRGTVRTVAGTGQSVRAANTTDGVIQVSGSIGARAGVRRYGLVVENPAAFTTGAFHAALIARGIRVDGPVVLSRTPARATVIGSVLSPRLDQLVAVMNRESVNLYAELLLRNAVRGPNRVGQGTAAAGQEMLRAFYQRRLGVDASTLVATDGSGLSTLNRITPRNLNQLLHYSHEANWGPTMHVSLPVAGTSALMRTRMRQSPAEGNLHAKTGTTEEVIGLAGYVTAENGEILAFSFLYNGTDRWNARSTIDVMGETLAGFARP